MSNGGGEPRKRIRLGNGVDSTTDNGGDNVSQEKKTRKKTRRVVIPSSYEVMIWNSFHVNTARYNIGARSIAPILCIIGVFILWALQWVPTIPETWSRFGVVYYLMMLPFYMINFFFPLNIMVNELYGIFAILNTGIFALQVWLLFLFGYNYYYCWIGESPYSCTANYLIDLIMLILTIILAICGLFTSVYYWSVTMRTSGTSRPKLLEYTNI